MKLAIIGTAGRGSDATLLTKRHWERMTAAAIEVISREGVTGMVSGGAAWADHVAVELKGYMPDQRLSLWLPEWQRDLDVAKSYHAKFSRVIGGDTWEQVMNQPSTKWGGFKDRNSKVAAEADIFLAMTFGNRGETKDGGTADTVRKMQLVGKTGYHLDLGELKLYKASVI